MSDSSVWRSILIVVAVLAVLALLAYARGEPGDDGRSPDAENAAAVSTGA